MTKQSTPIQENLKELFSKNGRLLTFFAVITIIFVGVTLVDNPTQWWTPLGAIGVFFIITFLFTNAKVFLKALVTVFLVLFEASWAFKIGSLATQSAEGSVWMASVFISFFTCLAISYLLPTSKGRWGPLAFSVSAGFSLTYIIATTLISLKVASIIGSIFAITVFLVFYHFGRKAKYAPSKMPRTGMTDEFYLQLKEAIRPNNWGIQKIKRGPFSGALVWNDKIAMVLTPVQLDQKLGLAGRTRNMYLSYKGTNINPWLTQLNTALVPAFGTKGADIMLVLLDEKSVNGLEPKTIGVHIPDSTSRLAVGIAPVKTYLKREKIIDMMDMLVESYEPYIRALKPKQLIALDYKLDDSEIPQKQF